MITNTLIYIGASYDTSKFVLGDILGNQVYLLPKVTTLERINLSRSFGEIHTGYKVYDTDTLLRYIWNVSSWYEYNNSLASKLVVNTPTSQLYVDISHSTSPTIGQTLIATSPTTATWQTPAGGMQFNFITSGVNTTAAMVLGTGSSLTYAGTGTVNASSLGNQLPAYYQIAYTNLTTIGSLTNSAGYLYNNGTGVFSYTNPAGAGTVTNIATTSPIIGGPITSTGTIGIQVANTTQDGYLTTTDWNTFNNKLSTVTHDYTLTGAGTVASPLSIPPYLYFGVVTQPSFTDLGTGSFTVGTGLYSLSSTAAGDELPNQYTIVGNTFTPTNGTTQYIVANYNAGTPIIQMISSVSTIDWIQIIPIFVIHRDGTTILVNNWDDLGVALPNKIGHGLSHVMPFAYESGLALGEATTRLVTIDLGVIWLGATVEVDLIAFNSSVNTLHFYYHVAGVWNESTITQYNNSQYDDGTDLQSLTVNHYGVVWIYRRVSPSSNEAFCVLGSGNYSLPDAQASQPPVLPPVIPAMAVLVGRIIVQHNDSSATFIQSAFSYNFKGGTVTTFTGISGICATTQGGTGLTSYVLGDTLYASAANTLLQLPGNITTTRNFLRQTGTGTISAAPAWDTVTKTDVGLSNVENTALSTWAGTSNITTVGTIVSGTWNGNLVAGQYGGTGVANTGKTITLGGNLTTSGAFATTLTVTNTTNVTLPTSGTLIANPMSVLGDMIYGGASGVPTQLVGSIVNGIYVLSATTAASTAGSPTWLLSTGTGNNVLSASPTLTGNTTIGTINKLTLTTPATGSTLTILDGKTFTVNNTLAFSGTDGSTLNIGTGGTLGTAAYVADSSMVHTTGNESIAGIKSFTDTTASTSTTTGAVTIAGGIGAVGPSFLGALTVTQTSGTTYLKFARTGLTTWGFSSSNDGVTDILSIVDATNNKIPIKFRALSMDAVFNSTTASTSTITGAVTIAGGLGVGGAVNIGGAVSMGALTATSGDFTSNLGGIRLNHGYTVGVDFSKLSFSSAGVAGDGASIRSYRTNGSFSGNEGDLQFWTNTGGGGAASNGSVALTLESSGAATFASSVSMGALTATSVTTSMMNRSYGTSLVFQEGGGAAQFTIEAYGGAATFASSVSMGALTATTGAFSGNITMAAAKQIYFTGTGYAGIGATAAGTLELYAGLGSQTRLSITQAGDASFGGNAVSMGALTATTATTSVYAVASLPTGSIGMRAMVNNALAPTFGASVVGGGTVVVPVYHDGVSWKVG